MQVQKTRNYIGLIGTLLALIGFFCPFASSKNTWAFATYVVEHGFGEYFEAAKTFRKISVYFFAAYLLFLAAAGVSFLLAHHKAGLWLTALPTVFFLIIFLQEGPELVSSSNVGFWLSAVGLALMLLASSLLGLNRTLFPNSVFYCKQPEEVAEDMNKVSTTEVCKMNMNGTRGYVGIVGAAMTLFGFFMPYATIWGFSASFYDYFCSEMSPLLAIIYIALLLGIGAACFFSYHSLGALLSMPYAIYYLICLVSEPVFLKEGQIGFWVTIIGVVLMVSSPYITKKLVK